MEAFGVYLHADGYADVYFRKNHLRDDNKIEFGDFMFDIGDVGRRYENSKGG